MDIEKYKVAEIDNVSRQPVIHVRYAGQSYDIPVSKLDWVNGWQGIGNLDDEEYRKNFDMDIRRALSIYLECSVESLMSDYVIEHHTDGNITVHPKAVFG